MIVRLLLDEKYRTDGSSHAGLILVSAKTSPENRHAIGDLVSAGGVEAGEVRFLQP